MPGSSKGFLVVVHIICTFSYQISTHHVKVSFHSSTHPHTRTRTHPFKVLPLKLSCFICLHLTDAEHPEKGVVTKMSTIGHDRNCSLSVSVFCDPQEVKVSVASLRDFAYQFYFFYSNILLLFILRCGSFLLGVKFISVAREMQLCEL